MIKTNIGAIIKTNSYELKEVEMKYGSAKISFQKKDKGKFITIVPLFEDTIVKVKKIENNNYAILLNNIDSILTKEVGEGGMITLNPIYLGLNVLIFPAPIE